MKIDAIGKVTHGATLSRIEAKSYDDFDTYPIFTMQDLSREIGQYSGKEEIQKVNICKNKFDSLYLSKINMAIIGLTSYKSIVINENHNNKLITSNFAMIEFDENKIDPFYFIWYFNEHPEIQKQLTIAMQGTIIRALSIQMLRGLDIPLPPLDIQRKIGRMYKLKKRKEKLLFERNILENELYNQLMINKLKEEIKKCQ
ncbi:restriction endonuclease subunit S [Clostridium sp.]|uniref:restriction endonuclease subunit S n=1 Tax=Clostridium sp. TaxID=1506 RepID=UPI0026340564|nr:restriction endonuclease subunit S [Clostridium sp.]